MGKTLYTGPFFEENSLLNNSNTLLSAIIESSPQVIIFALDCNYCYLAFNNKHQDTMQQIWGKKIEIGMNMLDVIGNLEDRKKAKTNFDKALAGQSFSLIEEYGDEALSRLFWQDFYAPILSNNGNVIGLTCFVLNITDRVLAEIHLNETRAILQAALENSQTGIAIINTSDWKVNYINKSGLLILNETQPENIHNIQIDQYFSIYNKISWGDGTPFTHEDSPLFRAVLYGETCSGEFIIKKEGFKDRIVLVNSAPIRNGNEEVKSAILVFLDITERKKAEEEILYLSYHDKLTGLYNRRFYEEEIKRIDHPRNLPISIILADVNGLKLINDAFGHHKGDELLQKSAKAIQSVCRTDDIVIRWGGDEIVILLPKTISQEAEIIVNRIKRTYLDEHVNTLNVSISFGWDTKTSSDQDIQDVLKNAEDHMYKNKLLKNETMRGNNAIKTIINTLHEKNPREEQHSKRVSSICRNLGKAMGLSELEVNKLQVVGLLHDIGKIAIEESILNKPGRLTKKELEIIQNHSEIGYRILNSSYDMLELADCVLAHHERWDGMGYPKGLRGNDIPLFARIIAIADSYDAMTSERPYRRALREEEAIIEIRKNAGTQFDPEIARTFIEKLLEESLD